MRLFKRTDISRFYVKKKIVYNNMIKKYFKKYSGKKNYKLRL